MSAPAPRAGKFLATRRNTVAGYRIHVPGGSGSVRVEGQRHLALVGARRSRGRATSARGAADDDEALLRPHRRGCVRPRSRCACRAPRSGRAPRSAAVPPMPRRDGPSAARAAFRQLRASQAHLHARQPARHRGDVAALDRSSTPASTGTTANRSPAAHRGLSPRRPVRTRRAARGSMRRAASKIDGPNRQQFMLINAWAPALRPRVSSGFSTIPCSRAVGADLQRRHTGSRARSSMLPRATSGRRARTRRGRHR